MALTCDQCGAPLDPGDEEIRVRCTYCGAVHDLARTEQVASEPPPPDRVDETSDRAVTAGCLVTFVAMAVAAGIGIFWLVHHLSGKRLRTIRRHTIYNVNTNIRTPRRRPVKPTPSRPSWRSSTTCTVDANDDGISDAASMIWTTETRDRPTLVDGATGRILWQGPSHPQNTPFYCVSPDWIVVARPGFLLDFHPTRNADNVVQVKVRDKLRGLATGRGCVKLRTADNTIVGVRLPSGERARCRAGKPRNVYLHPSELIPLAKKRVTRRHGDRRFELRQRKSGTPMLTVTAWQNRKRLWSRELPFAATRSGTSLTVTKDRIVILCARTARRNEAVLLGLNPGTGARIYALDVQPRPGSGHPHYVRFNGRYLVISYWIGLHAFDPATGKRVWSVGR